ncbi:CPBP family intramembrane glutamic endopeptidase [Gulosibacter molinativorax]|uniref:CPBP family intramembrane glutamic endopeptidase n=1 Tax=Gulosibacter molinativorax TaxID=256821 RepID=UPI001FE03077|nr:CPBP family intramembrane glutamic endopeptidase [Gulosibacter molinativorax]QUY62035.1 Integral membrane protein [Gulosibacter molinativorax]
MRLRWEIWLVLGLSLLPSALTAIVRLLELAAQPTPLGDSSSALNPSASEFPVFDVAYRLISIGSTLVPVALVIWLLWSRHESGFRRIGLDAHWPGDRFGPLRDFGGGLLLAAGIGIPGLALYAVSRAMGLTVQVVAGDTSMAWWTVGLLVLSALRAALLEEVVVVGYLATRLHTLGWGRWSIILASAVLRGSYHLYQGVPMAFGNVVMGIVYAYVFTRKRRDGKRPRVMPLVIAHFLLDVVSFLGYPLAAQWWPGLF